MYNVGKEDVIFGNGFFNERFYAILFGKIKGANTTLKVSENHKNFASKTH